MIPSRLTTKNSTIDPSNMNPSLNNSLFLRVNAPNIPIIHKESTICHKQEPMASHTIRPEVSTHHKRCTAQVIVTKSSGKSVPTARIVSPINKYEILKCSAILKEPLMIYFVPNTNHQSHNINNTNSSIYIGKYKYLF